MNAAPNPTMLDERRVLPIALGANWIYALPAADPARDGVLLVDAGPDYDGAWEALTAQLQAAGLTPRRRPHGGRDARAPRPLRAGASLAGRRGRRSWGRRRRWSASGWASG